MQLSLCRSVVLFLGGLFLPAHVAWTAAQDEAAPPVVDGPGGAWAVPAAVAPRDPEAASGAGPVRRVEPDTYYVRDKDGDLIPMINVPYERIHDLVRAAQEASQVAQPPAYTIQEFVLRGTADAQRAELSATLSIRLHRDGWVRVPLQMPTAILLAPPVYEGGGKVSLGASDGEGYTCWLQGSEDQLHQLQLQLAVPVRRIANEFRVSLASPRATSSELELRIDAAGVTASVNSGLLEVREAGSATRLAVRGLGGDFEIAWRQGHAAAAENSPLLDVESTAAYRVEGFRKLSGVLDFKVGSLRGSGLDDFSLRLPPGMRLVPPPFSQSRYSVTEAPAPQPREGTLVQVKLNERSMTPVEVQLLTVLSPVTNGGNPVFDVGGVEVENAARHSGVMEFTVKGDFTLGFEPGPEVTRTIPPPGRASAIAARFQTFDRTYSLRVEVSPKDTQVSVEPLYVVDVEPSRVRLAATLKYRIRGSEIRGLNVLFPDWRITSVQPESLIDVAAMDRERRDPLYVPLKSGATAGLNELTLQIDAVQEIADSTAPVSIVLPRPEAKTTTPGIVALLCADNVALSPMPELIVGLERDTFPPPVELPGRQEAPWYYREQGDAKESRLGFAIAPRERSVSILPSGRVSVRGREVEVQQSLEFFVRFVPLRYVLLSVPRSVEESGSLRLAVGREPVDYERVADETLGPGDANTGSAPAAAAGDRVRIRVDLMQDRINSMELAIRYSVALPAMEPGIVSSLAVPLVLPAAEEGFRVDDARLELEAGADLGITVPEGLWQPEASFSSEPGVLLASHGLPDELPLSLLAPRNPVRAKTVVRQAWLQSVLLPAERRERAAWRLASDETQLRLRLPTDARLAAVALDGAEISVAAPASRELIVPLDTAGRGHDRTLEVWYALPRPAGLVSRLPIAFPELGNVTPARVYWQLVVPGRQHLLSAPAGMTREMEWRRSGLFWTSHARLDQADLERWMAASRQPPLSASLRGYLFSALGSEGLGSCAVAPRSLLVLVAAGTILLLGLLLLYFPSFRHPAGLFVAGVVLFACVLLDPDQALSAVQAVGFGLLLAASALVLKRVVEFRRGERAVVHGSTLSSPDSNTVHAAFPAPSLSGTTATATAADKQIHEAPA